MSTTTRKRKVSHNDTTQTKKIKMEDSDENDETDSVPLVVAGVSVTEWDYAYLNLNGVHPDLGYLGQPSDTIYEVVSVQDYEAKEAVVTVRVVGTNTTYDVPFSCVNFYRRRKVNSPTELVTIGKILQSNDGKDIFKIMAIRSAEEVAAECDCEEGRQFYVKAAEPWIELKHLSTSTPNIWVSFKALKTQFVEKIVVDHINS